MVNRFWLLGDVIGEVGGGGGGGGVEAILKIHNENS